MLSTASWFQILNMIALSILYWVVYYHNMDHVANITTFNAMFWQKIFPFIHREQG